MSWQGMCLSHVDNCFHTMSTISEQFVIDPAGNFMGMCLKVLSKVDKDWITLMLWMVLNPIIKCDTL